MSELLKLAERCEAETDVEMQPLLLEEAWEACAEACAQFRAFARTYVKAFDNQAGRFSMCLEARAFESAAMMLVPEGAHFGLGHDASGPLKGWAWVRVKVGSGWKELHSPARMGFNFAGPYPQSPPLAICAAALRARHAQGTSAFGQEGRRDD